MKIEHVLTETQIEEWKATKELCLSPRSDSSLGASALSSCRSQGLRRRDSKVKATYGGNKKRKKITGKVKGKAYGGSLPDYS
jgi:hypothetical protein|tara:strand:- start:1183 stop:1428 length:246 start_codon:yes stop_codon:yes gene_type:complete